MRPVSATWSLFHRPRPAGVYAAYVIVSPDSRRVSVVWEDMLWAIDARPLQVVDALSLPSAVDGMAQSVDGIELYLLPATMGVLAVNERGMYAVDAATLELRRHAEGWPPLILPFFFAAPAVARR